MRPPPPAILIISEDLDEVMAISDRILVMYEGQVIGTADPRTASREQVGLMMAGVRPDAQSQDDGLATGTAPAPA